MPRTEHISKLVIMAIHDGDYPLAPFPSPARSCASIPLATSWCKSLWSPGLKCPWIFGTLRNGEKLLTRSSSLSLWPQEGMSLEEWKFRKGSLRKSSYFRNWWIWPRFTETGLGKRCELNVDQEHAPATYRKALIEIIAQYLGAVVRCGNSMKLRQETRI